MTVKIAMDEAERIRKHLERHPWIVNLQKGEPTLTFADLRDDSPLYQELIAECRAQSSRADELLGFLALSKEERLELVKSDNVAKLVAALLSYFCVYAEHVHTLLMIVNAFHAQTGLNFQIITAETPEESEFVAARVSNGLSPVAPPPGPESPEKVN